MQNKKTLLALSLALILLLGGAFVAYQRLTANAETNQLAITQPQNSSAIETASSSKQPAASSEQPAPESSEPAESEAPAEDEPQTISAPDFTVYDKDGGEVKLSDYFGKPIVLNFWASWCGPCKMEMPDFDEKNKELGDKVQFLMINATGGRETLETATQFIEKSGYTFPVFYDTDQMAAYLYQIYSLPTTYFINADGEITAYAAGAINSDILQKGIDMIYTEK
ncbi:MAG: TlpA family protein disulfide reductase [Oscillospiraceae bacterium]|nr:TlpA family protein disulfide reductase [Oscillospiraceae bacterium]